MILSVHKKLSTLKNLSMLEPNFEEADGLGICYQNGHSNKMRRFSITAQESVLEGL